MIPQAHNLPDIFNDLEDNQHDIPARLTLNTQSDYPRIEEVFL